LFEGTGNVLQQSSSLFWDNTNGRLGIGTSSPSTTFAIGSGGINRVNLGIQAFEMYTPSSVRTVFLGYSSTSGQLIISSGGSNDVNFLGGGFKSISTGNFAIGSTTDAGFKLDVNGTARVQGANTNGALSLSTSFFNGTFTIGNITSGYVETLFSGTSAQGSVSHTLKNNSNFQVNYALYNSAEGGSFFGTARANSLGITNNNASRFFIGNVNNADILIGTNNLERMRVFGNGNIAINTTTDAGYKLDVNGTARVTGALTVTSNITISSGAGVTAPFFSGTSNNFQFGISGVFGTQSSSVAVASGLRSSFIDSMTWVQSSGTGEFASFRATPTYNTTGTYSGIVRGFHYNPTLTSLVGVTAHYAFHSTSGRVRFENLPTSATGLSAGDIWNDAGTLKIV
jgi:hypothetical protein